MSIRKSGKILAIVGFIISFSCIGILYSNLTTVTEENSQILTEKNSEIASLKHTLSERDIEIQNHKVLNNDLKTKLQDLEDDKELQLKKVEEANNLVNSKEDSIHELKNRIQTLEVEKKSLDEELSSCHSSSDSLQMSLKTKSEELLAANNKLQHCESSLAAKPDEKVVVGDGAGDVKQDEAPPAVEGKVKELNPVDLNLAPPNQEGKEVNQPNGEKNIPQAQNPAPADVANNPPAVDNNKPEQVLAPPPPAANPQVPANIDLNAIQQRNEDEVNNIAPLQPAVQVPPQDDDIKQADELNDMLRIQQNPVNDNL